jgi:preprotein translocase subunit YajC
VVTRGGVVGTVQSVKDTTVTVRSLESKFEVEKQAIERVTSDKSDLTTDKK